MASRQELRPHVRDEPAPDDAVVVVRGGPTTQAKLEQHARRTHDAFVLDAEPLWGVSVFCALDDIGPASLRALLERFASYRVVHLPRVGSLRQAGLELLPSFERPHFTVRLPSLDDVPRLMGALGEATANRYHWVVPDRR